MEPGISDDPEEIMLVCVFVWSKFVSLIESADGSFTYWL